MRSAQQVATAKCFVSAVTFTRITQKRPREGVRWRWSKRILKCRGTLINAVNYADFHRITSEHNRAADRGEVEVHRAYAKMKRRAASTKDKPSFIYVDTAKSLSRRRKWKCPSPAIAKRTLSNKRTTSHPSLPESINDLEITDMWTTTGGTEPQPFLFLW